MRYFVFSIASSSTCFHYTKSGRKCKRFLCKITIVKLRICAFLTIIFLLTFFKLVFMPYMLFPIFTGCQRRINTQKSVFHTRSYFYTYTGFCVRNPTWHFWISHKIMPFFSTFFRKKGMHFWHFHHVLGFQNCVLECKKRANSVSFP